MVTVSQIKWLGVFTILAGASLIILGVSRFYTVPAMGSIVIVIGFSVAIVGAFKLGQVSQVR